MREIFWLDDEAWAAIAPLLPTNQPGARRVDDRRIISGIIHVLKSGCRWKDCPPEQGPLASDPHDAGRGAMDHHRRRDGWELREGASLCPRRKRGAKAQAIGLSRGGQGPDKDSNQILIHRLTH
jgi:transposase